MPATTEPLWRGLVDDAAIFPPGDAPLDAALAAYREREEPLVGAFVLRDTDLPQVEPGPPLAVVLTGGAGQVAGPAALATRHGHTLARLEIALRDLDDLPGNARRVVAAVDAARAVGDLDDEVAVHVELPALPGEPTYGWLAAADEVASAELLLKLRTGGLDADAHPDSPTLAAWIDAALDRETAFKCTAGLHRAVRHTGDDGIERHGFLNLLLATRRAFDGASRDDVVATLEERDGTALAAAVAAEDLAGARRWFRSFGSCSVSEPLADLDALGVLA
ncbi:hypothetical protein [uncultured Nocardioides sp.]|uniref:hypothetical protein n=1 Tax=uncultured Nocardioides sp. TaxID=198441 RepID=UPI0030FA2653